MTVISEATEKIGILYRIIDSLNGSIIVHRCDSSMEARQIGMTHFGRPVHIYRVNSGEGTNG